MWSPFLKNKTCRTEIWTCLDNSPDTDLQSWTSNLKSCVGFIKHTNSQHQNKKRPLWRTPADVSGSVTMWANLPWLGYFYSSMYSKGSGGSGSCSSSSILGPWAETGSTSSSSSSLVSFRMMIPPVCSWWQTGRTRWSLKLGGVLMPTSEFH